MIILDENKHFNKLINEGFEKYPNKRDLIILCKHWISDGFEVDELCSKMKEFCSKWNSRFNYAKSENLFITVINSIKNPENYQKNFEFSKNITIFKEESSVLSQITDEKQRKVLFVLISLAKWRNSDFVYFNSGGSLKVKEVFALAGVNLTIAKQKILLHELQKMGYIDIQLKPLLKCFIPIIKTEGEKHWDFDISDEVVSQIKNISLSARCVRCGSLFEKHNNKQKYCEQCAKIISNEKHAEIMRQKRNVTK